MGANKGRNSGTNETRSDVAGGVSEGEPEANQEEEMIDLLIDFDSDVEKRRFYSVLKGLKGKNAVQIKKWRKKRSDRQRGYYFACIVQPLADAFGYFPDEMHEELKKKFNPVERVNRITGEVVVFGGSTKDFDTLQTEAYHESIRVWALSEYSILLRLPNEYIED
jgi:hypothetical protein